jgi:zinc transport system permease protein
VERLVNLHVLSADFMIRALVAAVFVGLAAPAVGIYLVQRRLALIGDGIGHIALTGVALGFVLRTEPVVTAIVVAAAGAVLIEVVRERGRASGDVALAMMFYGGIAGGVLLIDKAASPFQLVNFLFGSLLTTSATELVVIAVLAVAVLATTLLLRPWLFAASQDEEYARVSGLPVRTLNLLLAVTAAVTVTVAMRVVGLLLVSALMVVPVAIAQQAARSFAGTLFGAIGVGVGIALVGTAVSGVYDLRSGPFIVVLALALFAVTAVGTGLLRRRRGRRAPAEVFPAPPDVVLET